MPRPQMFSCFPCNAASQLKERELSVYFFQGRRRLFLRLTQFTSVFLAVVLILVGFASTAHAVGGTAPGGPGASSVWTPSNNTIRGTAETTTSDVWFTGYNGIIGEVFFPTA